MKKYILVTDMLRVNELYQDGYRCHTHTVHTYHDDMSGRIMSKDQFLMSLQEPSKYDDMTAFKKMPITFEEQPVPQGWKGIHHTSKEMILKKAGEDEFYKAMREWLAGDGELDSVISIVEDYCY